MSQSPSERRRSERGSRSGVEFPGKKKKSNSLGGELGRKVEEEKWTFFPLLGKRRGRQRRRRSPERKVLLCCAPLLSSSLHFGGKEEGEGDVFFRSSSLSETISLSLEGRKRRERVRRTLESSDSSENKRRKEEGKETPNYVVYAL